MGSGRHGRYDRCGSAGTSQARAVQEADCVMPGTAATTLAQGDFSDVYVDETSQTKHQYLALGGLIVPTHQAEVLARDITSARLPELPHGEMAWTKVSRTKLASYQRVVDVFFDKMNCTHLDFHVLVVDTTKIRDAVFNAGSRESGFNKEIYQLLQKLARLYRKSLFHIYLDKRETKSPAEELRLILNRGIAKTGDSRDWPFRRVHFRESSSCQIIQVVDILLGAVAFHMNGHRDVDGASPAKCQLSDYILAKAHIRNPLRDTSVTGRFTIWHRRLR